MSPRQAALAASLSGSAAVTPAPPPPERAVFTDEQIAAAMCRVFTLVTENRVPQGEPSDGWWAVAHALRVTYGADVEPVALTAAQLADVIRGVHGRAERTFEDVPFEALPPEARAGWRAAAVHGYNLVVADAESLRETPLAEQEDRVVAQAQQAILAG